MSADMKNRTYQLLLFVRKNWARVYYLFHNYLNINIYVTILMLFVTFLIFSACRQNDNYAPPSLTLSKDLTTVRDSATVGIGYPFTMVLDCKQGDAPITNLVISLTTEKGTEIVIDSGMYCKQLIYSRKASYGASDSEKWTFFIRDKNGKSSSQSLIIFKDRNSAFGPIVSYPSVRLGFQDYTQPGNFLSLSDGKLYSNSEAVAHQQEVNVMAYWAYKAVPPTDATFSSPAEADAANYYPVISSFSSPLNEIRYKADSLSIGNEAFEKAYNDSLILTNYTSATSGKRKFKNARPGYIIPFQVTAGPHSGSRGLIRVMEVERGAGGYVDISVKMQKKTK